MAACAALYSFRLSLYDFLNSSSIPPTQLQLVRSAYAEMEYFIRLTNCLDYELLRKFERWRALQEGIRDAVWRVEDMLYDHFLSSHFRSSRPLEFTLDLQTEMNSFIQLVANVNKELRDIWEESEEEEEEIEEEEEEDEEEEEEEEEVEEEEEGEDIIQYEEEELQSTSNYGMVGLVDEFIQLRRLLLLSQGGPYRVDIVGMVGIGKTAMAKQLYNDPLISKHFKHRVFVSIGRSPWPKQVFIDILSQIQDRLDIVNMQRMSETKLRDYLAKCVAYKRYLIMFDDVWSVLPFEVFYLFKSPETRVLITTRKIYEASNVTYSFVGRETIKLRLLNEEESWRLFCEKVFGKHSYCPHKLVEFGQKIVENCEGLPLAIIAVADILAQGDMSVDHWKKVSEDPNPLSIGTNHQHPSLNTLYSSYEELDQSLQPCFLYMGIFPRRQEIPVSKLTRLWEAERLVQHIGPTLVNGRVSGILRNLSSQSVIFTTLQALPGGFKTFRLHSVFWHLCASEARKEYIVQVVDKFSENSFRESLNGHRRICVHNNTLFGIRDANNLMLSMPNARSLLCTGPYHPYPVPVEFKMRLLRVLDVVTIRFYVFPSEVVQLVLLRYLAFTYNGLLHASISQLCNLESLIVEHHMRIISLGDPSYMPVEIWNMKKLRHFQVTGALLPHPPEGAILPNLFSISKINARCLTTAVFNSIPGLQKLSIQIDLSAHDPFCFSAHLSRVNALVSLKCVVLNPKPRCQTIQSPAPSKIFPSSLSKLTLSGFGYPWKYFKEFSEFGSLKVLKLRRYAFQGPACETSVNLRMLKVLLLEDLDLVNLDLVNWTKNHFGLPDLRKLIVRHCYKLREIPSLVIFQSSLELIELVEVQPSVVASAKVIVRQLKKGVELQLNINCSCEDGNYKAKP